MQHFAFRTRLLRPKDASQPSVVVVRPGSVGKSKLTQSQALAIKFIAISGPKSIMLRLRISVQSTALASPVG